MRILFLTPSPPRPDGGGAAIRNWHLIRAARETGHLVDVFAYRGPRDRVNQGEIRYGASRPRERIGWARLRDLLFRPDPDLTLRFGTGAAPRTLALLLKKHATDDCLIYNCIQVEGLEMWPCRPPVEKYGMAPAYIYDAHNAEATLQQRTAAQAFRALNVPGAAYSLIQWLKLRV
jgi:hypothetical protein